MERTQLFDLMGELKLFGMKAAFDEIMATAVKRPEGYASCCIISALQRAVWIPSVDACFFAWTLAAPRV